MFELSEKQIKKNDKISIEKIKQDIIDTQKEINQYRKELSTLSQNKQENRLEIYIREGKIIKREAFINKLEQILNYRNK